MLTSPRQRGVSLVEAMVALVIGGILLAMAMPNFSAWIAGTRIRSTTEGLLAGLQYAKSEATTRNTQVRFQLTSSLDATCVRSATSTNWIVDVVDADADADSVVGQCNAMPSDTAAPSILQVRSASETGSGVAVNADADQVVFNGLGRQVPVVAGTPPGNVTIDVTPSSATGRCVAGGGKITCLRIVVSPAGQVRMCNPAVAATDPQSC
ncbi:MAG: prepilin-type N-terminal cleavage/methylation domain-containing protein [Rubrivivax sp.]|nr:MAG: prepilin-type N-terminal cleavage/methylation domain-containing protein [Rubrivivax sp.]